MHSKQPIKAMSFVAGAAISTLFDVLLDKLKSSELFNFTTAGQVRSEMKKWEKMLRKLQIVLEDAEEKQITNRYVKSWLVELKHLAYDVEDILDEFSTECLRRKVNGQLQATSSTSNEIPDRFNEITDRFNEILEEKKDLNLIGNVAKTSNKDLQRPPSTCLLEEPTVYGRDGDKDKIIELFDYKTGDPKIGVIPIVGMGGLGKTTLAKLVYDDEFVHRDFQVKAWVCVSDDFDVMRVTKAILESITGKRSDLNELNSVQLELKKCLAGRKILLVLDDVWTKKLSDWNVLSSPFKYGAVGSKIIVTTRSTEVANMVRTVANYHLNLISEKDCWLLFTKYAFQNRSIAEQQELEAVGRELVMKRCGGLPLAAKALGGLLLLKQTSEQWKGVLNNKLWSKLKESSELPSALYLSYYYLPSHLKRCFAYCAIIPKDYEFEREKIILLWMAEGLIPQGDGEMEKLGRDYFDDLMSRSIFQASNAHKSQFIMHDLVNDLAQEVAENVCFRLEDKVDDGEVLKWDRVRYSSYIRRRLEGTKRFAPVRDMKCLRTFLPLPSEIDRTSYLASCVPDNLLQNLKFVRVLSFSHYRIYELPDSIGDLKHLRYLDLSGTYIKVLPESTTSLCNLQTLILKWCKWLSRLPTRMDNLRHLRHLDIVGVDLDEGIPLEITQLGDLQSLHLPEVDLRSFPITNLMNLKSLRGELSIKNLDNTVTSSDALKARMNEKEGIHVLKLKWEHNKQQIDEVQYDVLNALQPHNNLKELVVNGYAGAKFPPWIATHSNIVHLTLKGSKKCMSLPPLGMLRNLKELFIEGMYSVQKVDRDFYGNNCSDPFPCLEVLSFEEMYSWEEWIVCEFEFRALRTLYLRQCDKLLGKLPLHLPSLEKLVIEKCENLVASLPILPKLSTLNIETCKEVVFSCKDNLSFLTSVQLVNISSFTNSVDGFLHRLKKFERFSVYGFQMHWIDSNSECIIVMCPQLMSMVIDEDEEQLQMELVESVFKSLTLAECNMVVKVPTWIKKLKLLKELTIEEWPSLVTISQGTMYQSRYFEVLIIKGCDSLISLGRRHIPPTLKKLTLKNCINLKSLLDEEDERPTYFSTNLEYLKIMYCESLTSISSRRELPVTLKYLEICVCSNLTHVFPGGKLPFGVQYLRIYGCSMIESIAKGFDSNSYLETLIICECSSLKSVAEDLQNLINLCEFELSDFPGIVSFPKGGLPTNRLTKLTLKRLEKLEALPDKLHTLSSLQELRICECPKLVSFPNEGLPSNLTSFEIENTEITKAVFEWGLDRLSSLLWLSVIGGYEELRCFPSDETQIRLPPSLTGLEIGNFPNLKDFSPRCFRDLTSLQTLDIVNCPKLLSFPKNGLPDSLLELHVYYCWILRERCLEGKASEWSKIQHIPVVEM